jgi:hypothetical protein
MPGMSGGAWAKATMGRECHERSEDYRSGPHEYVAPSIPHAQAGLSV